MRRRAVLISCLTLILISTALYAKKKPLKPVAPAIPQMTEDQKILHALNRLTFGARPSDVEQVRRMGLPQWIDAQLHPETIAETPVLESKLAPLDSLAMSPKELVQRYPSPQIIKAMVDGRLPLPADARQKFLVQKIIARYEAKQQAGASDKPAAALDPKVTLASLNIDA